MTDKLHELEQQEKILREEHGRIKKELINEKTRIQTINPFNSAENIASIPEFKSKLKFAKPAYVIKYIEALTILEQLRMCEGVINPTLWNASGYVLYHNGSDIVSLNVSNHSASIYLCPMFKNIDSANKATTSIGRSKLMFMFKVLGGNMDFPMYVEETPQQEESIPF